MEAVVVSDSARSSHFIQSGVDSPRFVPVVPRRGYDVPLRAIYRRDFEAICDANSEHPSDNPIWDAVGGPVRYRRITTIPANGPSIHLEVQLPLHGESRWNCGYALQRVIPMVNYHTDPNQGFTIQCNCHKASCPACGQKTIYRQAKRATENMLARIDLYERDRAINPAGLRVWAYSVVTSYDPRSEESLAFFSDAKSYARIRKRMEKALASAIPGYIGSIGIPHHYRQGGGSSTDDDDDAEHPYGASGKGATPWREGPHMHFIAFTTCELTDADIVRILDGYDRRGHLMIKVKGHGAPAGADPVEYHDPIPCTEIQAALTYFLSHACVVHDTDKESARVMNTTYAYGFMGNRSKVPRCDTVKARVPRMTEDGVPYYDMYEAIEECENVMAGLSPSEDLRPVRKTIERRVYTTIPRDMWESELARVDSEVGRHNRILEYMRDARYSEYDRDQAWFWNEVYEHIRQNDPGGNNSDWQDYAMTYTPRFMSDPDDDDCPAPGS